MAQIKVVPISYIGKFVSKYAQLLPIVILFGGDRFTCCDEAVVAEENGQILALATIAPNGEEASGETTIVGLYTLKSHRRKGLAKQVLLQAIVRCLERKLSPVRIDVMSTAAKHLVDALPDDVKKELKINLQPTVLDMLDQNGE